MPASDAPRPPAPHLAAAAQAALATLTDELGGLLLQELQRLSAARAQWRATGSTVELRLAAHDLRGLGATYGVPLAGRIAGSLDRLLATTASAALIETHLDAITAVVREDAAAEGDPRGVELATALENAASRLRGAAALQAA